ncbi:hypothetical protein A0H81_07621 [Grifola frondosa]|uniref:Uncharacterized protein n=1 Tax=Grifola frondosa TaxID=5627 RepID=A0A1C7M7G1_GRIFR|nr:hypothetical protein A0H81_07621 [Grifola frondosa]
MLLELRVKTDWGHSILELGCRASSRRFLLRLWPAIFPLAGVLLLMPGMCGRLGRPEMAEEMLADEAGLGRSLGLMSRVPEKAHDMDPISAAVGLSGRLVTALTQRMATHEGAPVRRWGSNFPSSTANPDKSCGVSRRVFLWAATRARQRRAAQREGIREARSG